MTAPPPGTSAGDLAGLLRGRIEALAAVILPDGKREGHEWRGTGPDGAAWSVVLTGTKTGVFANWADPERQAGDPLEFIRWGITGGDRRAAFQWALDWLGERRGPGAGRSPPARPPPPPPPDTSGEVEARRRAALALYLAGQPIAGTPAELYLAGRGIAFRLFASYETFGALRFAPALRHPTGGEHPAMVAAVIDPATGDHLATHRTFLALTRDGCRKASVRPAKMALGNYRGGMIPLLRGASRRRLRDAPEGDTIVIGEGIENTLSAALLYPDARAAAAVAVGNLGAIALPPAISTVILARDRDGENDAVAKACERALRRWMEEGRGVVEWKPPPGFEDANAWWQAQLASGQLGALP